MLKRKSKLNYSSTQQPKFNIEHESDHQERLKKIESKTNSYIKEILYIVYVDGLYILLYILAIQLYQQTNLAQLDKDIETVQKIHDLAIV